MKCIICDNQMKNHTSWAWHCGNCEFWRSNLDSGAGRGIDGLEGLRRDNFKTLCDYLEREGSLQDKTCLEVGCAEGWFLDEVKKRNASATGIEPSDVAKTAKSSGHHVEVGFFPDVLDDKSTFDIIIFNDVFEHLPDPIGALKACEVRLKPQGRLVLNLPSSAGIFYKISQLLLKFGLSSTFERLWQKGLLSPHLTYFNETNLIQFVSRYSKLDKIQLFRLPSIQGNGLRSRINATHTGIRGQLLYAAISFALPVINRLPSDIIVLVFRKPS